jgi:hypothetical protein
MGTTGNVLVSYDVNTSHNQVKQGMKNRGCSDVYGGKALPNTTVWHQTKNTDQAIADIRSVCTGLGVTLERAVAVKASEFLCY